jgi:hypothetical protein
MRIGGPSGQNSAYQASLSNLIIGYAGSAASIPLFMIDAGAAYKAVEGGSQFGNEPRDPLYFALPRTNVYDFQAGRTLFLRNQEITAQPDTGYHGPL